MVLGLFGDPLTLQLSQNFHSHQRPLNKGRGRQGQCGKGPGPTQQLIYLFTPQHRQASGHLPQSLVGLAGKSADPASVLLTVW